jgi:transcription elongation factor GreA
METILEQSSDYMVKVTPGRKVTLFDEKLKEIVTFTLVSPEDSDPGNGKLSLLSPLGSSLLGRGIGDRSEIYIFGRREVFRIVRIDPFD